MNNFPLDYQNQIILAIGLPSNSLSMLATSFVLALYFLNPSLQNFPFRLIVYLQTADFIMSFGQFMNVFMPNYRSGDDDYFLCHLQAYICQYGALSTMIWAIIITTLMALSLNMTLKAIEKYEKNLIFMGFHFPALLSIIPFLIDGYGGSGVFCWISMQENELLMDLLMFFMYYLFLWFAMIYNSFVMFYIRRTLKKLKDMNLMNNEHFYEKIKFFPLVLIIWWVVPSIHRLYMMVYREDIFILAAIHVFCESSYGFANMMLYALNPKVKKIIEKKIRGLFSKEEKKMIEDNTLDLNSANTEDLNSDNSYRKVNN